MVKQKKSTLPSDPWWRWKLDKVTKLCRDGDEGDTFFLQITSYPVTRLYLRTGEIKEGTNGKRAVHMTIQNQPSH
jgi:hypothetical protein